jgi:hypothetical protein
VSVEAPAGDGPASHGVLACVTDVRQRADGGWLVTGTFTRRPDADTLAALRGGPSGPPSAPPPRPGLASLKVSYQCLTPPADPQPRPGRVVDLGPEGVSLLVGEGVGPGALLSVELVGPDGAAPLPTLLASVVQVAAGPDGGRVAACRFIRRLSGEEWERLFPGR